MTEQKRLPAIPSMEGSPWALRAREVFPHASITVRASENGLLPLAMMEDGPENLDEIAASSDEETKEALRGWTVLKGHTERARQRGFNVTVYGGEGIWELHSTKVLSLKEEEVEDANTALNGLEKKAEDFVRTLNRILDS